jgi:hypothetical protein
LAVEGKELTVQQDLFLNNEIDESVEALKFIPLTSAEKVLDSRIIKPSADGKVTWGDGFVTDLNNPLGPMRHLAKHIAWDFMNSMKPYEISADVSGEKYCECKNLGWFNIRLKTAYKLLYIPARIFSNANRLSYAFQTILWDIYRPEKRIYSIDHMDGNPSNNNFCNLRMTKNNSWNSCRNVYGIPGVHYDNRIKKWIGKNSRFRGPYRYAELLAAKDRIQIMGNNPECEPSDIEAFLRRTLTALAYRERNCFNALGKSVPLEDLDVRVPSWLSYPAEHFLKHQPALQY